MGVFLLGWWNHPTLSLCVEKPKGSLSWVQPILCTLLQVGTPTWDRMTCRVYFKVESSFCWKTPGMQISDSIVIVVSYWIRSNFRFALAVLKRKIFTAAASVQGGLSCSIKILASCVITCQKACLKSFNPTFDKVSTQPLTGKSHAGWDPCAGAAKQIGTKT